MGLTAKRTGKVKLPWISRSRYERELELLAVAYGIRTDDLRARLMSLIERFSMVVMRRIKNRGMEVHVKFVVSETELQHYYFSPAERDELWWHVGRRITEELKKQSRAVEMMELTPQDRGR
jgi:hypothetical protein